MKAHITKKKQGQEAVDTHLVINGTQVSGRIPFNFLGAQTSLSFRGHIGIEIDTEERTLNASNLYLTRLSVDSGSDLNEWDHGDWVTDDAQLLLNLSAMAIFKIIEDNEAYLIDNHNDFEVGVCSTEEEVYFSNVGGCGYLLLTLDESMQDVFDAGDVATGSFDVDFDANYYEVGFDMSYQIELTDDTAELKDVVITLDDYDQFIKTDGKYKSTSGPCSKLDAELIENFKRRIKQTVAMKFDVAAKDVFCALHGTTC